MKPYTIFLVSSFVGLASVSSFAQDKNSWGETFTCSVNWFAACATTGVEPPADSEKPKGKPAITIGNLPFSQQRSNLPEPVRNVLENPSPETAKAYVTWSRQANEKLAKATEYIAQATREMNASAAPQNSIEKPNTNAASSLGPVGLYYFFSPGDQTALKDVGVLNKIFQEGKLGVVGIPVRGKDEEIIQFLNETKPLFPVRRSDAEVRMIKPSETPDLYLAFPLEKKLLRLGPAITETEIMQAIGNVLAVQSKSKSAFESLASDR
jgi:hypothetical protein